MLAALMICTVLTSFGQEANKKLMKARGNLQVAQKDTVNPKSKLMEAQKDTASPKMEMMEVTKDYASEIEEFKNEADLKLSSNQKHIAVLRGKYLKLAETDEACMEKISKLEQKNSDLKKSLADYQDGGKNDWLLFKNRFNDDMDELQNALKEFAPEKME